MPWFTWLQILQCPFLSLPGTPADINSCALCYTHFYHRGPCCLPLPPGSWLLQSFFLPSSDHAGLSLAEFDVVHLQGPERPSIHQSLTHSLRAKQKLFWGTSDPWDVWEWIKRRDWLTCVVFHTPSATLLCHCSWNPQLLQSLKLCLER